MNADEVLSYCPVCAAPIYGPRLADPDESRYGGAPVPVRHSCDCRQHLLALVDAKAERSRAQAEAARKLDANWAMLPGEGDGP